MRSSALRSEVCTEDVAPWRVDSCRDHLCRGARNHERRRIDACRNHKWLGAGENRRIRRPVARRPLRGVARRSEPLDAAEISKLLWYAAERLQRDEIWRSLPAEHL